MKETTIEQTQELIKSVQQADSAKRLLKAVQDLAQWRSPEAIPTLVEVLGFNNPGAAVAAVDGLIALGEKSVTYLLENLDNYNYGARAWAIRVFAGTGDPRALNLLQKAATSDFSLSVRRAAARGLGLIKWEQISSGEKEPAQTNVFETLLITAEDGEWVVRYATVVALESLAKVLDQDNLNLKHKIQLQLSEMLDNESEIAIKARVKLALSQLFCS
jgi:phycocyanobilin lyase beta subunit